MQGEGGKLAVHRKQNNTMFMFLHTGERPLRCVLVLGVCAHNIHAPLYRRGNGETGSAQINVYVIVVKITGLDQFHNI